MRWTKFVEDKPYPGDRRVYTTFAWLPIEDEKGNCAWLEKVQVEEEYRINPRHHWVITEIK